MNAIRAVRSRRAEMNVPPSRKAHLFITTDRQDAFRSGEIYITKLAYAEQITISSELPADAEKMVSTVTEEAKLFMPMAELIDLDKERARLEKELEKARKNYEGRCASSRTRTSSPVRRRPSCRRSASAPRRRRHSWKISRPA